MAGFEWFSPLSITGFNKKPKLPGVIPVPDDQLPQPLPPIEMNPLEALHILKEAALTIDRMAKTKTMDELPGAVAAVPGNVVGGIVNAPGNAVRAVQAIPGVIGTAGKLAIRAPEETLRQGAQAGAGLASAPYTTAAALTAVPDFLTELAKLAAKKVGLAPETSPLDGPTPTEWLLDRARDVRATTGKPQNFMQEVVGDAAAAPMIAPGAPAASLAFSLAGGAVNPLMNPPSESQAAGPPTVPKFMFSPEPMRMAGGIVPGSGNVFSVPPGSPIQTVAGPNVAPNGDFTTLGLMALTTLGMAFAPWVAGKLRNPQPKFRPVPGAKPGTFGISNLFDYVRTQDDATAGLMRQADRLNVPPSAQTELQNEFHAHSHAGARSQADTAVRLGRTQTGTVNFNVPVSIQDLSKLDSPEVSNYLHVRSALDILNQGKKHTVHGMNTQQALALVNQMEAANPRLRQIGNRFRENNRARIDMESTGEYATMTKKKARQELARAGSSTHVPDLNQDGPIPTVSAFDTAGRAIHNGVTHRIQNEARGRFIDVVRKANPRMFPRVTEAEMKNNPGWRNYAIPVYRRGKKEWYSAEGYVVDTLRFDPPHLSNAAAIFRWPKIAYEATTTGPLAPWFAFTAAYRNFVTGKHTSPHGMTPTVLGSIKGVGDQLGPQIARAIATSIDRGSAGWLTNVLGPAGVQGLSQRMRQAWDNSLIAQVEARGSHRGSIADDRLRAKSAINNTVSHTPPGPTRKFIQNFWKLTDNAWRSGLNAIQNAPQMDSTRRRIKKGQSIDEAVMGARNMTGDPRVAGQYYVEGKPIRFEGKGWVPSKIAQGVGLIAEGGRLSSPWFNVIQQSNKRMLKAFKDDPAAFVSKLWIYTGLPSAAQYFWAASLGPEYVDDLVNKRTMYQRLMNWKIYDPTKPPSEGIEIPGIPQELSLFKAGVELGLDQVFNSRVLSPADEFRKLALNFLGVSVVPPLPTLVSYAPAAMGVQLPFSMGQGAFVPPADPLGEQGVLPQNIEMLVRQIAGAAGDVFLSGMQAWAEDDPHGLEGYGDKPGKGVTDKIGSGVQEAARRAVTKTPLLRDLLNIRSPMGSSTAEAEEFYAKNDAIRVISEFFTKQDRGGGTIDLSPASKKGGVSVQEQIGDLAKMPDAGGGKAMPLKPPPPKPTNPLYIMFAEELYVKFQTDNVDPESNKIPKDIQGWNSLWRRHSEMTQMIRDAKSISAGNHVGWENYLNTLTPENKDWLVSHNVNTKSPTAVANFATSQRMELQRYMLRLIQKTEKDFSQRLGRPIKFEDIKPYAQQDPVPGVQTPGYAFEAKPGFKYSPDLQPGTPY